MGKAFPTNRNFAGALQTKAVEDGAPLPYFVTFANLRVNEGVAGPRPGIARLTRASTTTRALNFVAASSQYLSAEVDPRVWELGLRFTFEAAVSLDDKTLTNTVICAGHTTPSFVLDTASNKWRARFWDSAATLTTLTSTDDALEATQTVQVVRSGATITMYVDGVEAATNTSVAILRSRTPVGDIRVARDSAGTAYLDGRLCYVRLFSFAKTHHRDRLVRFPDPTSRVVLCDYDFSMDESRVRDRSRFDNTLLATNTPTVTTALCHQGLGVDGVTEYVDSGNERRLLLAVGGTYVHAEV